MESDSRNVRLVKADLKNFDALIDLAPDEEGKNFVASNVYSLAEAYANVMSGRYAQPFGIYDGDTPVGFLMIGYDIVDEGDDPVKCPYIRNSYLIWRFMVDEKYLHQGYGKAAMKLILDFIRTFPAGPAEYCWITYEPENERARNLYRSFGFIEEPELPEGWDEIPALLKL
ncbi:MAG: GNAT family N-acetyltransferase [Lachnospiraceae bacterium]|nr:GNAT family N-acetyltransferase [Lachnospiraceae bacterium]